ncbi:T9SS type A sorting domain-containing protein [Hymenobacter aquaticus]|uniref:T9SS type A sorting domain-containing protein n=1 Tax=Hymenobacter aquaticus TaxID=1867101 RepID=A0A4Z0Q7B6_9BACT|nr:T9SS type A sorting domain-containing protein [Hymenobacter aquaticus]TGE25958.1 T9SS type A sorting domain-containing protein [Hymenobacter aquaticus]
MMKKILSIGLLCLGLFQTPAVAHKEWVHQYMVKQSYLYLEQQIGAIPALRDAIGLNYHGKGNDAQPFNNSYPIGVGAWREDSEDPIYHYDLGHGGFTPSITHFWDADNPNENYESVPLNIGYTSKAPNAWEKARVYLFCQDRNGAHDVTIPFVMPGVGYLRNYIITYTSLPELYKGNYYLEGISNADGSGRINYYHQPQFNQAFGKPVALQILGRVAHLLGDMSVPAHTHSHLHPCPANRPDHYENDMGNTYYSNNNLNKCEKDPGGSYPAYSWTAATAAQQGGLLTDIHCMASARDKAKFLFYTMNQLADFFPSGVNYSDMGTFSRGGDQSFQRGDTNLSQGSNAYINSIYSSFGWTSPGSINTGQIANVSFNFSIRAVATLFQWFAYEAGIISDLKNQQIANYSGSDLLCGGANAFLDATSIPVGTNVTWSVEPSSRATGSWFQGPMGRPIFNVTATPDAQGPFTVKATYWSTDGCYAGPVTLTHEMWNGGPDVNILYESEVYGGLVCPGSNINLGAGISRPDLEGNVSYEWTVDNATFTYGYGSGPDVSITAPGGYNQMFTVWCTATNGCRSTTTGRTYMTANENGINGMACVMYKPGKVATAGSAAAPASAALEVFPNPSNTGFELVVPAGALLQKTGSTAPATLAYTLRDNLGRVVAQGTRPNPSAKIQIDTRELPAGVYSLSCTVGGQTFHKRVQVLH